MHIIYSIYLIDIEIETKSAANRGYDIIHSIIHNIFVDEINIGTFFILYTYNQ